MDTGNCLRVRSPVRCAGKVVEESLCIAVLQEMFSYLRAGGILILPAVVKFWPDGFGIPRTSKVRQVLILRNYPHPIDIQTEFILRMISSEQQLIPPQAGERKMASQSEGLGDRV